MFGKGVDERLRAMKAEVVVDGVCDALVLLFFEKQREVQSEAWKVSFSFEEIGMGMGTSTGIRLGWLLIGVGEADEEG